MPSLIKALKSQVGRKFVTGVTGLGLILFLIAHLLGNLTIFGESEAFDIYSHTLENLGPLLYIAEAGLVFLFLYHAILGISIWLRRRKARPEGYRKYQTKGGPSHQSLASRSMVLSGVIILVFLVFHIMHFKYGLFSPDEGTTVLSTAGGIEARNLRALVVSEFQKPLVAFGYSAVLAIMILHLSFGAWSAFTSLGMSHNQTSHRVQIGAYIFAIILMLGFIFIPLYIYFTGGHGGLIAY
jgi:succinate dehydrogenase / fumarate reductase cytochrome b subunit